MSDESDARERRRDTIVTVSMTIGPIITAFILTIGILTLLVVGPLNNHIDKVEASTNARIDRVEERLREEMRTGFDELNSRIDALLDAVVNLGNQN